MLSFGELFCTLYHSRLNSRVAAIDEKNLQVEGDKASLVVKTWMNGEMYVKWEYFVTIC